MLKAQKCSPIRKRKPRFLVCASLPTIEMDPCIQYVLLSWLIQLSVDQVNSHNTHTECINNPKVVRTFKIKGPFIGSYF